MPRYLALLMALLGLSAALPAAISPRAQAQPAAPRAIRVADVRVAPGADGATVSWTTDVPAAGAVRYGPAAGPWTETVGADGLATAHTVTIGGLEPGTAYTVSVEAFRGDGSAGAAPAQTFTTAGTPDKRAGPPPDPSAAPWLGPGELAPSGQAAAPAATPDKAGGPASDDFNRVALGGAWTLADPLGGASTLLTGTDLRIRVPDGPSHNAWTGANTAVRVLQATANVDFTVEAKFNSRPTGHIATQGLVVEADDQNYVRFDVYSQRNGTTGAESLKIFAGRVSGGTGGLAKDTALAAPGFPIYLRIARAGSSWTMSYRYEGGSWVSYHTLSFATTVTRAGVYAGNFSDRRYAPPFTASVDYVHNTAAPLPDDPVALADGYAPTITIPPISGTSTSAQIAWFTDEPATAQLTYSSPTAPGGSLSGALGQAHSFSVTGLQPGATYRFAATATDTGGRASVKSVVFRTPLAPPPAGGPAIDVWYGDAQSFGAVGNPQRFVNILGKVTDPDGFQTNYAGFGTGAWPLRYTLNGGPAQSVMIGPGSYPLRNGADFYNYRRTYNQGDFNIEIDRASLSSGNNSVVITAVDALGNTSTRTVTVNYTAGKVWPLPYTIDWSQVGALTDVAQPVDGLWALDGDGVRPVQLGYDRLLAIGDVSWQDFEVLVPITIHEVDAVVGNRPNSGGPGVGMIVRWQQHFDASGGLITTQPRWTYYPMGGLGWYRLERTNPPSSDPREMFLHFLSGDVQFARDAQLRKLAPGTRYLFRMRVQTGAGSNGGNLYSMKVWEACASEPAAWTVSGAPGPGVDVSTGSLLLVAHHVDATFGDVAIGPLNAPPALSICGTGPTVTATLTSTATGTATSTATGTPTGTPESGGCCSNSSVFMPVVIGPRP